MELYHNPRCSKSRAALSILNEKNIEIEIKEYLKVVPSFEELKSLIGKLGIKPQDLIRKGEADYKENYKGKELSDTEWIEAMVKYPKLIERPILINGDKAIVGRPPESILEII